MGSLSGRYLYIIQTLGDHYLEVKLTAKGGAGGDTLLSTTYPTLLGRQTNIMTGVWTSSYTCGSPMPADADRLEVSFYSSSNPNDKPWIALDNVEIKEVGTCDELPNMLAAESPPPPPAEDGRRLQDASGVSLVNPGFETTTPPPNGWSQWSGVVTGGDGWFQTGAGITDSSLHPVTLNNVMLNIVPAVTQTPSAVSTLLKADCATDGQETGIMTMVSGLLPNYEYEATFQLAGGGTKTALHDLTLVHLMQEGQLVVSDPTDFDMDAADPSTRGLRVVGSADTLAVMMHPQHIDGRKTGSPATYPDSTLALDYETTAHYPNRFTLRPGTVDAQTVFGTYIELRPRTGMPLTTGPNYGLLASGSSATAYTSGSTNFMTFGVGVHYCRDEQLGYNGLLGAALRNIQGMFDSCAARSDCAYVSFCCVSGADAWGDLYPTCEVTMGGSTYNTYVKSTYTSGVNYYLRARTTFGSSTETWIDGYANGARHLSNNPLSSGWPSFDTQFSFYVIVHPSNGYEIYNTNNNNLITTKPFDPALPWDGGNWEFVHVNEVLNAQDRVVQSTHTALTPPNGAYSYDATGITDLSVSFSRAFIANTEYGWSKHEDLYANAELAPRWQVTNDASMASTTASGGAYDAGTTVLVLSSSCATQQGGAQMQFAGLSLGRQYRFSIRAAGGLSSIGGHSGSVGELSVRATTNAFAVMGTVTHTLTCAAEHQACAWDTVNLDFTATEADGYIQITSPIGSCVAVDAASIEALQAEDRFDLTWASFGLATTQCTRFQGTVAVDTTNAYGSGIWSSTGATSEGVVLSVYESTGSLIQSYAVANGDITGVAVDVEITSPTGAYFAVSDRGDASGDAVYITGGHFTCNYVHNYFHNRGPMGIDTGVARVVKTNTGRVFGQTALSTVAGGVFAGSWAPVSLRFVTDGTPDEGGTPRVAIEVARHAYQCLVVDNFAVVPIGRAEGFTPGNMDDVGHIEVWVSRNKATWGTRAARVETTTYTGASIPLRLTEGVGGDPAEGRYVYIRSFETARELRIDGVDFLRLPGAVSGRRLEDNASFTDADPPKSKPVQREQPPPSTAEERRKATPKTEGLDHDAVPVHNQSELEYAMSKRIERMRNLTGEVCEYRYKDGERARYMRRLAAQWWAQLSPGEADVACIHCVTKHSINCTAWFMTPWGFSTGSDEMHKKRRKLREEMEQSSEKRQEAIGEAVGKSCCRTSRKTGKKECGKQFCQEAFGEKMRPRMAHTLRRMHDNTKSETTLSVSELVATDIVAPHLHHDPECGTEAKRKKRGEIECVGRSLVKHLADKHGFSQSDIDKKLDRYGLTISQIITSQLKHMSTGGEGKSSYRSDPAKAEAMAAARRKEKEEQNRRRMEQGEPLGKKRRRRVGPRGSWLKQSTVEGRRRLQESGQEGEELQTVVIGVEPLGDLRPVKKRNYEFAVNQSRVAKQLMRAANLGAAQHGRASVTQGDLLRSAWDASLGTDGSLFGRARSVVGGVGHIAERVLEAQQLLNKPVLETKSRKRRLAAHEHAYLDGVDRMLQGRSPGFQPPDEHLEKYGWIVESVDWVHAHREISRVAALLEERHEAVYGHIEEHGTLPVGDINEEHRTGYSLLDMNVPPSRLGEYIRMLVPRMRNRRTRKLQQRKHVEMHEVPRAEPPSGERRSVIAAFMDAAVNDRDPITATWDALQHNDHKSTVRRLSEGFLGGASYVLPTTPFGGKTYNGEKVDPPNLLQEFARWVVYDVALCYLYPPTTQNGDNFGDGTGIQTHYSDRMCWPALPFAPPRLPTFGEMVGISEDYDWNQLEYAEMCNSDTVKALIGPFSGELTSIGFLAAPYGSLLRFAEGIDSIRNLGVMTVGVNHTEHDRAAAIACGFAQFGGVLWLSLVVAVMTIMAATSLPCALCCLRTCRRLRRGEQKARERSNAVDEILQNAIDQGKIEATGAWESRRKPKIRVRGAKEERKGLLGEVEADVA